MINLWLNVLNGSVPEHIFVSVWQHIKRESISNLLVSNFIFQTILTFISIKTFDLQCEILQT